MAATTNTPWMHCHTTVLPSLTWVVHTMLVVVMWNDFSILKSQGVDVHYPLEPKVLSCAC